MKAKFVYESVNFERGRDPRAVMEVGVFGNMPKIGQMQPDSFDLKEIAKTICSVYFLPIKNFTPIDFGSNFMWSDGYQYQFITMNLDINRYVVAEFLGDEYWDRIESLLGEDYVPKISLGISSYQKKWISKNDKKFEFIGNRLFCRVKGSSWTIPTDFQKEKNISKWLPEGIKDAIMQQAIWDLRYTEPMSAVKIPSGSPHMRDREDIKIDVRIYCDEYGQEELEKLMKKNYMWAHSVSKWNINDGILSFID